MNSDLIPSYSEPCICKGLRYSLISSSSVSILMQGEKRSDSVLRGAYILLEEEYIFLDAVIQHIFHSTSGLSSCRAGS